MNERQLGEVGQIVANRRARLQMDAAGLASAAGVDPKTLRSLERGERWPRDRTLRKIEVALQWQPGSLDSIKSGGSAIAIDGLAAVDEFGEERFYIDPNQVDVPDNTPEESRYRSVLGDLADIQETMRHQPDRASVIADRRIRAAGRLLDSAAESLSTSDKSRAVDDLDASVVVIRSTIAELQKEIPHAEQPATDAADPTAAARAQGTEDQKNDDKPTDLSERRSRREALPERPDDAIAARRLDPKFGFEDEGADGIGEENQDTGWDE
ncbi:hypothetical protein nbrc107696_46080 [Gordonia spumicola]|uniref:HTH cro/C1-type domain-containing protein n=1 Tax=Gordonia spumicola TaxID=589161 RepID=A0A7I9VG23_9ACTN|nr:helix-turn-helix transcriptional regulator [Gordonia spumicola]GEE00233.1 hypothetical protein nbrc107696_06790 [Gordonia spumicola]GEE04162.1 hypothetical protein nbrc107696_46080 [Gordonia spumicola]